MNDLSLKGVARRYGGITGGFSVKKDIFKSFTGTHLLRSKLELMARQQFSFDFSECIYGGTANFVQIWTHIVVRIRLVPDAGISNAMMNTLRTTWQNGIQNTWSNRWGCSRSGELTCPLTFQVQWVNSGEHHTVRVRTGPAQSNVLTWDTNDTGAVAAHEFGHMLGHNDEYTDPNCPDQFPVNTGTVMDNNSNNVPARLMTLFAVLIGSSVVAL